MPFTVTILYTSSRPDLLEPGSKPKAPLELISDSTLVTDVAGLYVQEEAQPPKELTVEELKKVLESETENLCLHKFQRLAVTQALTQPLTIIQVFYMLNQQCIKL